MCLRVNSIGKKITGIVPLKPALRQLNFTLARHRAERGTVKYESRSARAVNETEIIKRCYLPLRSVNPRSNKAAVETARVYRGRNNECRRDNGVLSATIFFHDAEWWREKEKTERFSPDDFLITRSQFRVFARQRQHQRRRKRHFARNGRQTIGERDERPVRRDAVGTIRDLCYLRRTRGRLARVGETGLAEKRRGT